MLRSPDPIIDDRAQELLLLSARGMPLSMPAAVGGTVGGAEVLRPVVERVRRRSIALERARRAREGGALQRAVVALEALGPNGLHRAELMARAGYTPSLTDREVVPLGSDRFLAASVVEALQRAVLDALSAFHGAQPAERGADRRRLAALGPDAALDLALAGLLSAGKVVRDGDLFARAGWKPRGLDDVPRVQREPPMLREPPRDNTMGRTQITPVVAEQHQIVHVTQISADLERPRQLSTDRAVKGGGVQHEHSESR